MKTIIIKRVYLPELTLSEFILPSGIKLVGLENPWIQNERNISCIPEGQYKATKRNSPLINRITSGVYKEGWEITNVVNRTFIMVHPGNVTRDTDGCILIGSTIGCVNNQIGIKDSAAAFDVFMEELEQEDHVLFWIKPWQLYQ